MALETVIYGQDEHILHARIGPVVITQLPSEHSEASFQVYLAALERELKERPENDRVAVVYYVPAGGTWEAGRRKRVNDVLARYVAKRRRTTSVWILCTPSAATRGVLTALFWVVKPPYEYQIRADLDSALVDVRAHHPEVSAAAFKAELARLVARGKRLAHGSGSNAR